MSISGVSEDKKSHLLHKPQHQHQHKELNPNTPKSKSSVQSQFIDNAKNSPYSPFKNHPQECFCKDCNCGRHMCNLQSQKLSLTLSSTYKLHYTPRTPYKQRTSSRPVSAKTIESPLLTGRSTYLQDFKDTKRDPLSRPKPEDLLKCKEGEVGNLTFYKQEYPGHKGPNQYVPMNPQIFRGGLQFKCNSTYSNQFKKPRGQSAGSVKPPDQFKMTGSWLGDSNYKRSYQNPFGDGKIDRMSYSQNLSRDEVTYIKQKNTSSHFKTTYGAQYTPKRTGCPAAARLVQSLDKSVMKENTNFRGMDNTFSSLSKW